MTGPSDIASFVRQASLCPMAHTFPLLSLQLIQCGHILWLCEIHSLTITHFPIPEDWVAGNYNVEWNYPTNNGWNNDKVLSSVTVPALLSADTSNFFFESLDITGDNDVVGPVIIVVVGESWHVTPTLAWEGTLPDSFPTGEPVIHGEIRYMKYANGTSAPSEQMGGTLYGSKNWSMISDGSVDYNAKTITLDTWSGLFDTNTNWPVGGYLVTITADTGNVLSETNESDNVIERLDIWSACDHPPWDADVCVTDSPSADTTPPVVSVPNNLTFTGSNSGNNGIRQDYFIS